MNRTSSKNRIKSVDQSLIEDIAQDAKRAKLWGLTLIVGGLLLQVLHLFPLPISGLKAMLIVSGVILIGSGTLFYLGSFSVPTNRREIIERLQKTMLDKNPERRLWAAQRLVGYSKDANFTKKEIVGLAKHVIKIINELPIENPYGQYIAADHVVLLREIAVSVPMDKHIRRDFVRIIKPLQKIKGFQNEVYEVLSDAIAYHPNKLPVQAYADLQKENEDTY